ncbi:MAG: amidohydrolase family protein [Oscillospiraceae bacterium]|nr:amidohydrolase family protein [Oscillospiraceae bacterium]
MTAKKIDCHTHIVNDNIKCEYFLNTDGFALVMPFIDKFKANSPPDDAYETVKNDSRLFLCPSIDISRDISEQLADIEKSLSSYRIVGLKIYLTYQAGRADDERLMCIYEFAKKHNLSVTYHTGSVSLVLPSDGDMEGSNAKYVRNVAERFPEVNFIVAHMDDPRYDECIRVMHGVNNMFTDFSGAYEPGTKEGGDIDWAVDTFAKAINQYPDTYKQIIYGTDFCPPINLSAIDEYDYTIKRIFKPSQFEDIYFNNCIRAFPKLKNYIKE